MKFHIVKLSQGHTRCATAYILTLTVTVIVQHLKPAFPVSALRLEVFMSVAWIDSAGGDWKAPAPSGVNVRDLSATASPAEAAALVTAARRFL